MLYVVKRVPLGSLFRSRMGEGGRNSPLHDPSIAWTKLGEREKGLEDIHSAITPTENRQTTSLVTFQAVEHKRGLRFSYAN